MEFKDRLQARMKALGLTAADIIKLTGVSKGTVSFWVNGKNGATGKNLLSLAKVLRCAPEWLTDGKNPPDVVAQTKANATMLGPISVWDDETPLDDDEVYVPFLKEVELSAGSGRTVIEKSSSRKLRFGKQTLRNQGVQFDQAVCVTVHGNSMEPVLPDGSTVGVDKSSTAVKDGKMYAIDHGGELRVKTLYRMPGGGLRFRSFNQDEHPDEEYTAQQLAESGISVLGKVFWYSVLL
ncbi:XRE family transcriptional regulator [Pseudomonas sp. FBF18]|jgi:phage repressor protein C with HTH and peptisase S24 domain|uniref:S24 family peptidase n=1 Tax=Pseudomonas sp. FBF18 TaxID=1451377 RepID=UPI0020C1F80C|nr:helix-turn-helix transcriptional regulator [Pseudomonas sp. FBF18]MCP8350900.1 XRE family transcriptional regulator [Pseudomonas sp. FBF18]